MELANDKYRVSIKIDDTPFTLGSADNSIEYDVVLNPSDYDRDDFYKAFCIEVQSSDRSYRIALVGSYNIYDSHCAVLECDMLTVLQDETISQIDLSVGKLIRKFNIEGGFLNIELYRVSDKYIVLGELDVIGLNDRFEKEWEFSGKDIFTRMEIEEDRIKLWDWEKCFYEIDFQGNLIDSRT